MKPMTLTERRADKWLDRNVTLKHEQNISRVVLNLAAALHLENYAEAERLVQRWFERRTQEGIPCSTMRDFDAL